MPKDGHLPILRKPQNACPHKSIGTKNKNKISLPLSSQQKIIGLVETQPGIVLSKLLEWGLNIVGSEIGDKQNRYMGMVILVCCPRATSRGIGNPIKKSSNIFKY
jgi:hypothetical protein